ncbi:MAG TPA: hypothetical protein VJB87_05520 [Candidatus Nanoarchaeia archaeon]|nr:hypothetical protein [Candidatus Nanoarchaeia archaeon]
MKSFNYTLAASISGWLLTIMVLISELYEPFKTLLANTFTHHWVGKIIITLAVYIIIGMFTKKDYAHAYRDNITSMSIILLFYVIHYFV